MGWIDESNNRTVAAVWTVWTKEAAASHLQKVLQSSHTLVNHYGAELRASFSQVPCQLRNGGVPPLRNAPWQRCFPGHLVDLENRTPVWRPGLLGVLFPVVLAQKLQRHSRHSMRHSRVGRAWNNPETSQDNAGSFADLPSWHFWNQSQTGEPRHGAGLVRETPEPQPQNTCIEEFCIPERKVFDPEHLAF